MSRHHDDPDAAFWGWCDVWLDPEFASWTLDAEVARLTSPALLIQGAEDPYGSLSQIDRIEALSRGPCERFVVPGGHSPHLEHPYDVATRVAQVVASLT
jgi:pimeloyl-ACP methyl ester carboxylesterase